MSDSSRPKPIEAGWNSYRRTVVPAAASEVQVHECRQAFYAGAAILWRGMMTMFDPGEEPTDADMEKMQHIEAELVAFGLELDLRYLRPKG